MNDGDTVFFSVTREHPAFWKDCKEKIHKYYKTETALFTQIFHNTFFYPLPMVVYKDEFMEQNYNGVYKKEEILIFVFSKVEDQSCFHQNNLPI